MERDLPDTLCSLDQVRQCFYEMEQLASWRRRQDIRLKSGCEAQAAPDFEIGEQLSGLLGSADAVAALSTTDMDEWLEQLRRWLHLPVTHLTFAVAAAPAMRIAMTRWFRAEVMPTTLLRFEVNRNIVGGMVVRTPSKIFDFSFRRRLERGKNLIPEMLNRA